MAPSSAEPPLVFIHDWFTDPTTEWAAQAARFNRDYDCHYFRLLGHGDDPDDYLTPGQPVLDANLTRLRALLESLREPACIVAHGVGAHLALRTAALAPKQLTCMVLIAPGYRLSRFRRLARVCLHLPWLLPLYLLLVDPLGDDPRAARVTGAWSRMRSRYASLRGRAATAYLRQALEAEEPYLDEIAVPVFLISGDQDQPETTRFVERLSASLPGSRLLRYGHLGHNPHINEPDLVNSSIEHFLAQHKRQGPLRAIGRWLGNVKNFLSRVGESDPK